MVAANWVKAACMAFTMALAGGLATGSASAQEKVLKIGVLGVMKGPASSWGLVNKYSAETTAEMYNEHGGVEIGGQNYRIQIVTVAAVFVMPWRLYNSPEVIHYTLDILGDAIGPLYGILVADYCLVRHERLLPDQLFSDRPDGVYGYRNGVNPVAVKSLIAGVVVGSAFVFIPALNVLAPFSWFIGVGIGGGTYWWMMARGGAGDTRAAALRVKPQLSS